MPRLRGHQEGSCDRQFGVEKEFVITGLSFGYYSAVLEGTSGIVSLFGVEPSALQQFCWDSFRKDYQVHAENLLLSSFQACTWW